MSENYKRVYIKKQVAKNLKEGHPWCFSGAIERIDSNIKKGDICSVYSQNDFLGIGYYNNSTDIAIRILSFKHVNIDRDFFIKRFVELKKSKEEFLDNTNAYRVVFGESDNLPGLVVDKYDNCIIMQIHTLGIEKLKQLIVQALIEVFKPVMIYEKSDTGVRLKEGLDKESSMLLYGKMINEVEIMENGFKFMVSVIHGQKTGFFLDQRQNRLALINYCKGKNVLNCFSYTGGFSVYAASVASKVASVDISKPAIELARKNFILNGFDTNKHEFHAVDVFDYLKNLKKGDFDVIVLDPPSFAKNRKQLKNAIKAYITINSKALEKLDDYSILVSSSCTTHIDETTFIKILHQSAINTGCQIKVLESKLQPLDHSYNLNFPEGRYLKYFVLQKFPIV
jgi:23S rRNA (cytosine1962-C5)-methyltransferase